MPCLGTPSCSAPCATARPSIACSYHPLCCCERRAHRSLCHRNDAACATSVDVVGTPCHLSRTKRSRGCGASRSYTQLHRSSSASGPSTARRPLGAAAACQAFARPGYGARNACWTELGTATPLTDVVYV